MNLRRSAIELKDSIRYAFITYLLTRGKICYRIERTLGQGGSRLTALGRSAIELKANMFECVEAARDISRKICYRIESRALRLPLRYSAGGEDLL